MDPDRAMEQAQAEARQGIQVGYRHLTMAWEQASATAGALTGRERDLGAFRGAAARATMAEPGSPAARVVVDQAVDLRRALGAHGESVAEVRARITAGVEAFSTAIGALTVMGDRSLDPQVQRSAEQARSRVQLVHEVGRGAQGAAEWLQHPLRTASHMLAKTAESTAETVGMPAAALSASRSALDALGAARGRAVELVDTLDQLYQYGVPAVPSAGAERAAEPALVSRSRQPGLERERRDHPRLRVVSQALGIQR